MAARARSRCTTARDHGSTGAEGRTLKDALLRSTRFIILLRSRARALRCRMPGREPATNRLQR